MPDPNLPNYKYFDVIVSPRLKGRKTHDYRLVSRHGDDVGVIRWYGSWRQYCFFPAAFTVWSPGCLADVCDLIKRLKNDHTASRRPRF